jgi:CBS domain-containing protein
MPNSSRTSRQISPAIPQPPSSPPVLLDLVSEPVARVRRRPAVVLTPTCPAKQALERMAEGHANAALVASHGVLLGMLTERDLVRGLLASPVNAGLADAPVFQLMSAEPDVVLETDTVGYAIGKLWSLGGRPLPIVGPTGALFGLLEAQDVLAWMADRACRP